jgi:Domain of unknown function (DUF4234)
MAELVRINGYEFKKRHPLGIWGLSLITLGIYYFVWYYKINKEARDYLGDDQIRPGIALLAVLLGWILLLIPPFVSTYRTGQRIGRMQEKAGVTDRISPGICLVLFIVWRLDMIYMQEHLNRVWQRYQPAQREAGVSPPPPPTGQFTG